MTWKRLFLVPRFWDAQTHLHQRSPMRIVHGESETRELHEGISVRWLRRTYARNGRSSVQLSNLRIIECTNLFREPLRPRHNLYSFAMLPPLMASTSRFMDSEKRKACWTPSPRRLSMKSGCLQVKEKRTLEKLCCCNLQYFWDDSRSLLACKQNWQAYTSQRFWTRHHEDHSTCASAIYKGSVG